METVSALDEHNTSLSGDEFNRIQNQLLELRTTNYKLLDKCTKQEREIQAFIQKEKLITDELQKANSIIAKSKKAKDVFYLEQEIELSRLKLSVQEEEFKLQQSTLLSELNKVVEQNEQLLKEKQEASISSDKIKLEYLQKRPSIDAYADKNSSSNTLNQSSDNCSMLQKLRLQNEEYLTKSDYFQLQLAELNDKLRRKQESYQLLSDEKERQYSVYKKSLDNVVAKKDSEIEVLNEQLKNLKQKLDKANEEQTESTYSDVKHIQDVNESFQIQLQECVSANDCLSNQLKEARQEISEMQTDLEETREVSDRRKKLIDEMNRYVEETRNSHQDQLESVEASYSLANQRNILQIEALNEKLSSLENVSSKMSSLESSLVSKSNQLRKANSEICDLKVQLEMAMVQHEDMLQHQKLEAEETLMSTKAVCRQKVEELCARIEDIEKQNTKFQAEICVQKQDIKDKVDQLLSVDKKHANFMRDLKKQIQSEKKRADKLQERLLEIVNESRNKSPGSEDFKVVDKIRDTKTNGETGSVSSWTLLGGTYNRESDRRSNSGDQHSESSVTMVENSDDSDLLGHIAQLQRQNFELTEKVHMLEESNSAMAEDLMRKAAVIEKYVKDKPLFNNASSSSQQHQPNDNRLPSGFKKMIEFVKLDSSAEDIREMNKRLQLMLEESLMKNMHLQRDLEMLSMEAVKSSKSPS